MNGEVVILAKRASKLANLVKTSSGVSHLGSVMTRLGSGMTRLGSGMTRLGSVMTRLGSGMTHLGSGTTRLGSVMTRLGSGMTHLGSGMTHLGSGMTHLSSVTTRLGSGMIRLGSGVIHLRSGITNLRSGVIRLDAETVDLRAGAETASDLQHRSSPVLAYPSLPGAARTADPPRNVPLTDRKSTKKGADETSKTGKPSNRGLAPINGAVCSLVLSARVTRTGTAKERAACDWNSLSP